MHCEEKLYAIREVSELTGIKPVTLRAWQRRYNIIQPLRTEKGHRLYTSSHVEQIRKIQGWLAKGVAIGKVKALLASGMDNVVVENSDDRQLEEVEVMLDALAKLNRTKADSVLSQVCKEYPFNIVQTRFIQPIFEAIKQVKRSQQTLQLGMFQSIAMYKLSSILEIENKVARKGKCLLFSLDAIGSLAARMWALRLAERGYSVSLVEAVEEMTALSHHSGLDNYSAISIFASQAPSQSQLASIETLSEQRGEALIASPLIVSLTQLKGR